MMVTETELRDALDDLADTARDIPDFTFEVRRSESPSRARWLVACAAAVVLVVLVAFGAMRLVGGHDASLPAGQPMQSRWDFVIKAVPGSGWTVSGATIATDHQSGSISSASGLNCSVAVFGRVTGRTSTAVRKPVHVKVNGRSAEYGRLKKPLIPNDDGEYVVWRLASQLWGAAECHSTAADAIAAAQATGLGTDQARVPFSAHSLPPGMRPINLWISPQPSGEPRIIATVASASYDEDHTPGPSPDAWAASIVFGHTAEQQDWGRRGSVVVPNANPGHTVWCNPKDGGAGIDLGTYSLYISGPPSCAKVLPIAKSLDLAANAADQSTWFTTAEAFG